MKSNIQETLKYLDFDIISTSMFIVNLIHPVAAIFPTVAEAVKKLSVAYNIHVFNILFEVNELENMIFKNNSSIISCLILFFLHSCFTGWRECEIWIGSGFYSSLAWSQVHSWLWTPKLINSIVFPELNNSGIWYILYLLILLFCNFIEILSQTLNCNDLMNYLKVWFFLVVSLETIRIQLFCLFVFPEKNKFTHIKRAKACVVLLYQQNLRSRSSYLFKIQKLNILCKIYINIFIIIKYRFLSCFTYTIGHLLLTKECPDIRAYDNIRRPLWQNSS